MHVAFIVEVFDDLLRIQGKSKRALFVDLDVGERIMQGVGDPSAPESRRGSAIADRLGAEGEKPRICGQGSSQLEL